MKKSELVENNQQATDRAIEFMKVYGLALLILLAVSVLVHVHPAFGNKPALDQEENAKSKTAEGPFAQAAAGKLNKQLLEVKWVLF
jgi:hypothetical protein